MLPMYLVKILLGTLDKFSPRGTLPVEEDFAPLMLSLFNATRSRPNLSTQLSTWAFSGIYVEVQHAFYCIAIYFVPEIRYLYNTLNSIWYNVFLFGIHLKGEEISVPVIKGFTLKQRPCWRKRHASEAAPPGPSWAYPSRWRPTGETRRRSGSCLHRWMGTWGRWQGARRKWKIIKHGFFCRLGWIKDSIHGLGLLARVPSTDDTRANVLAG